MVWSCLGFAQLCRDCKLLDKSITPTDVDLIFTQSKPKAERKLTFPMFLAALNALATKKFKGADDSMARLEAAIVGACMALGEDDYVTGPHRWHGHPIGKGAALASLMAERGHEVAAVIVEPVQGAGGIFPATEGYLESVRRLCDQHGAYLVFDEVITGFGRLGNWFAAHHYGVTPDFVTFAKAITSGYQPLGGVFVGPAPRAALESDPDFFLRTGFTYSGHATACAAAIKNLEIMRREKVVEHVADEQGWVRGKLAELLADTEELVALIPTVAITPSLLGNGATELLHIFISAAGAQIRPGATGKPVPGYQACILDADGQPVAVRSSATTEDAEDASFAGLQDTFLWVLTPEDMAHKVRECWGSLYSVESMTDRYLEIFERVLKGAHGFVRPPADPPWLAIARAAHESIQMLTSS